MNRYRTSAELKNNAKNKMTGKFGSAILMFLLSLIINNMVTELCTRAIPRTSPATFLLYAAVSFLAAVALGVFQVGISYFYLNIACGQPYNVNNLFYGFREQTNKALALSLIYTMLQYVCLLPMQYFMARFLVSHDVKVLGYLGISMVIGYAVYIPIALNLSQMFFLMLDFPEWSALETVKGSIRIMKGHKKRLFFVELSFIPLMVLCLLSVGIGYLWLMPYMKMTMTNFFLDLMNPQKES